MRVALLATSYPAHPDDPAGHFVRAEARWLARQGHEVHVVAPSPWPRDEGITAHACGGDALLAWPGAIARARQNPLRLLALAPFALAARAHLRRLRPAHLVAHWAVPCAWPLSLGLAPSREVVLHGADVRLLLGAPLPVRSRVLRDLAPSPLRFVATALLDALSGALPHDDARALRTRARVEPPRVDIDERRPPTVRPFARYAVVCGRLIADKRVDLAVAAVARLPSARLLVVGDGPERPRLERLARELAPGQVVFTGSLARAEALGHVADAVALLHPSAHEGAPTVVLEALALGVPVISCGAGDTKRWASEGRGEVVVPEPDALARGLSRASRGLFA